MLTTQTVPDDYGEVSSLYFHPVGLTALMYLIEVLKTESYEECPAIVNIAREFGVKEVEIRNILYSY